MLKPSGVRRRAVRGVVLAVTAWVTVVALGSALVWAVISRAGEGVVGGTVAAGEPAPTIGSAASRGPTDRPSRSAGGQSVPADPSASSDTSGSATPATPTGASTPRPGGPPPSSPTSSAAPPASSQQRTWSGKVGSVTAECTSSRIRYRSALPASGFKVEWEYEGASQIKVKFERTGEQEGETEVRATCRNGVPQFVTESRGDD